MSKRYNIKNLEELQAHLFALKSGYMMQEDMLKQNTRLYVRQYSIVNLFKKYATPSSFMKVDEKLNVSSKLMSLVLPIIMNSTLFRGSGFMTKALVGLATSKMGKSLDAEHLSSIFTSVKGWFNKSKKPSKRNMQVDYGIPPDSETF
ncbi:hypothetical protein IWX76_001392 [Pedobacter sp. CAN_A7]|uniref:hypothetical protein n=1 Tax=Pedobacter sp. CAN_A7 TaxID=2787722 RepID=UPI0018C8F62A